MTDPKNLLRASRPYSEPHKDPVATNSKLVFIPSSYPDIYKSLRDSGVERIFHLAELGIVPHGSPAVEDSFAGFVTETLKRLDLHGHPSIRVNRTSAPIVFGSDLRGAEALERYDTYLEEIGRHVSNASSPDLLECDGFQIDSAMWTYPHLRELLGVPELETDDWIAARCRAFMRGYLSGQQLLPLGTKGWGIGDSRSLPANIFDSTMHEGESFWTLRGKNRGQGLAKVRSFTDGVLEFFRTTTADPGDRGFVFNISAMNWSRKKMSNYVTASMLVYRWLFLQGQHYGVPVYWMGDKNMWGSPFDDMAYPRAKWLLEAELFESKWSPSLRRGQYVYTLLAEDDGELKVARDFHKSDATL